MFKTLKDIAGATIDAIKLKKKRIESKEYKKRMND